MTDVSNMSMASTFTELNSVKIVVGIDHFRKGCRHDLYNCRHIFHPLAVRLCRVSCSGRPNPPASGSRCDRDCLPIGHRPKSGLNTHQEAEQLSLRLKLGVVLSRFACPDVSYA